MTTDHYLLSVLFRDYLHSSRERRENTGRFRLLERRENTGRFRLTRVLPLVSRSSLVSLIICSGVILPRFSFGRAFYVLIITFYTEKYGMVIDQEMRGGPATMTCMSTLFWK